MTPRAVRATAPGKINLSLAVGRCDERGYHPLATVFHAVGLLETVTASRSTGTELSLAIEGEGTSDLPADSTNLALRAAEALRSHTGFNGGAHLHVHKTVPVAGGMGGGSADAAATLVALNELWELGLGRDDLTDIAATLGADVPFSLRGHTALGTRYGDVLSPVMTRGSWHWVLALPGGGLSTPTVYRAFDDLMGRAGEQAPESPVTDARVLTALLAGNPAELGPVLSNDLQPAAFSLAPDVERVVDAAKRAGALGVVVSGSGPTVAALVADAHHALDVEIALLASGYVRTCHRVVGNVPGARLI
ncbi:4-(cytidine 5'-diphospho)-2-C-methyl-D-erythritol kinase [Devriesea agamarum]|uniref:4-(cytidine 5'-diphospho)-2-C-methyl-D-erythritol kinase n=1 Tax=Devriesea agamarum TaxID=472569 RepID=UPI00071CEDA5|nr:4-(cytidine 5'-diphospho)-2-C-methyl-D-erythritol kinase [Devriesea agamarum]